MNGFLRGVFTRTSRKIPITIEWLLSMVEMCPKTGCWLWKGSCNLKNGYGQFGSNGKKLKPHRFYFLAFRPHGLPHGLHALHVCDVKRCCNPWHIFPGTNLDNRLDSKLKGRVPKNENHWNAKINLDIAEMIRSSPENGIAVAKRFGVSRATVCRVRRNQMWLHPVHDKHIGMTKSL